MAEVNGVYIPELGIAQNSTDGYYVPAFGVKVSNATPNTIGGTTVNSLGKINIGSEDSGNYLASLSNLWDTVKSGISSFGTSIGNGIDSLTKVRGTGENAKSYLDSILGAVNAGWNIYSGIQNLKTAKNYYSNLQNNARSEFANNVGTQAANGTTHTIIGAGWSKELGDQLASNYQNAMNTAISAGTNMGADMSGVVAQRNALDKYRTLAA